MTNESLFPMHGPMSVPSNAQRAWNRISDASGLPRTDVDTGLPPGRVSLLDRLRSTTWWLPFQGRVRLTVQIVVAVAVVAFLGYSFGSRHPAPPPASAATIDRTNGLPSQPLDSATVFRAPANDSLRVTILNGSTAVLAPRAVLTTTPRRATSIPGALADVGDLRGFARFDIKDTSKKLVLKTISGIVTLDRGVSEVNVVPDTMVVRVITGRALVRPGGFWSWKPAHVLPGYELRAVVGHYLGSHSAKPIASAGSAGARGAK